jgi:uncharacterized protein
MPFSVIEFFASIAVVSLGSVLQAATGLGAGIIIVPLLALINLELIPGPVLCASLTLSFTMAWKGRADIRYDGLSLLLVALVIGMGLGAYTLSWLPVKQLGIVFGSLILLAVGISFVGKGLKQTNGYRMGTGFISGYMGATVSIGAPVLALLYQHEKGPSLRATLGFLYFVSTMVMLLFLHLAGYFNTTHLQMGLWLVPGFVLGYFIAGRFAAWFDQERSRMAVLIISTISALILIGKNIFL